MLSPPVEEFELLLSTPRGGTLEDLAEGPQIVLCVDGSITVTTMHAQEVLGRGEAVFVPAAQGAVTLSGRGRAALARPPV